MLTSADSDLAPQCSRPWRTGLEAVWCVTEGDWPLLETPDLYDELTAPDQNLEMGQGLTGNVCQQAIVLLTEVSSVRLVECMCNGLGMVYG